jgi:predicted Zn finger-like uncharacterized protein
MFTVCPKCALTLMVTAADLRVAQGYVRCGRCSSVFNALARLSDERKAAGGETPPPSAPETATPGEEAGTDLSPLEEALARPEEVAPLAETAEEPISDDALEFDPESTDVGAVFVEPPPNPQWTAATGSFKAMVAASQEPPAEESPETAPAESRVDVEIDAAFLAEMLREPAAPEPAGQHGEPPRTEPQRPEPERPEPERRAPPRRSPPPPVQPPARISRDSAPEHGAPAPAAATRRAASSATTPASAARHASPPTPPPAEASARPRPAETHKRASPVREAREDPPPPEEPTRASLDLEADDMAATKHMVHRAMPLARLHPHVYTPGAVLGLLVLLAQIVNHYRDELAATARFNRPLTALYASFGVQLMPHWDLRAYDVRQLGAAADPAGSGLITVRASIKNAGHQPQPLPVLRVTLQDRFGNRIAARDVAPRFYVPHTMPDSSYLAGGQRVDAEMGFVDPGANAVGFEIDACLPTSGGVISCANDLATR